MSQKLISLNSDLKQLQDEGYEIEVRSGHLLVSHVPYLSSDTRINYGTLVCPLSQLKGDQTGVPSDHTIFFNGDHPCDLSGNPITGIKHSSETKTLADGVEVNHMFSNKPANGYTDYYNKVTTYIRIIESQAQAVDPSVTSKTFMVITTNDPETPFHYLETNSIRGEITPLSSKFENLKIAIIGLGGTGSYILDFISKTPVKEIHLFDSDAFLSHNAFRAPGAPSIEELRNNQKKINYLQSIYSKMHKGIITHDYHVDSMNVGELVTNDFVFICIDALEVKREIISTLQQHSVPFIDVGVGINLVDGLLSGSVRTTLGTPHKNDHLNQRISFAGNVDNEYSTNIQIAEINALNAALAVIKWKKIFGFYHDLEKEHNMVYDICVNKLINDDHIS